MADYLYKTRIWFDTTDVIGVDVEKEAADTLDFETNYKANCYPVNDLELMETYFLVDWTYDQLKQKITDTGLDWTDVKLETADKFYDLYVLSPNQY